MKAYLSSANSVPQELLKILLHSLKNTRGKIYLLNFLALSMTLQYQLIPLWIFSRKTSHMFKTAVLQNFYEQFVGNKAKERISKRVLQEDKARKFFRITNICCPICYPFVTFATLCSFVTSVLSFAFLPTSCC